MPHQSIETRSAARLLILFGLMAAFATIHILRHRQAIRQTQPQPVYENHGRQRSQSRRRRRRRRGEFYDRSQRGERDWDAWDYGQNERPNNFYGNRWNDDELDGRTVVSGMDGLYDRNSNVTWAGGPAPATRSAWEDGDDEGSTLVDEPIFRDPMGGRRTRR